MSRGQAIDTRLEKLIPATNEWFTSGLYNKDEIHGIMKQRTNFEYRLAARPLLVVDVELAIDFELDIERHIQEYTQKNKLKLKHRWSVVERCDKIYKIGMQRLKNAAENAKMTSTYVAFLKRFNRSTELSRHFAFKIQKWPNQAKHWIQGIEYELETNAKFDNARSLTQEGLRNVPGSVDLWCLALKLELQFAEKMLFGIRDQHWSEHQAQLKKAAKAAGSTIAVAPLDGDFIAELVSEENEALGQIVCNLGLAKVILSTGFASDAFSTDLVLGFYRTAIQFRCTADLVMDILKDGLQLLVAKATELDDKFGTDHATGVRLVAPQLVNKKVNPILGVISQLPLTLARHQLITVRECLVLPPAAATEDADAEKQKKSRKTDGNNNNNNNNNNAPFHLKELTADEKLSYMQQSMSLFSTLIQESITTTAHADDDDDDQDDNDQAAKRRLQVQHEALKVVAKAKKSETSLRKKTMSDYVWSVVLGHHHHSSPSQFDAAPLCPLLANLTEWLVTMIRETPLPCFVQQITEEGDDAVMTKVAAVGIAGHNSSAVNLQDLTALCLPYLEESKLIILTKARATGHEASGIAASGHGAKTLPAFLLLVESLKSAQEVKQLLTQQTASGELQVLVSAAMEARAVAVWKIFALCHVHSVAFEVGTSFKKAGGYVAAGKKIKKKKAVQAARTKRNRGGLSDSDDSDSDSSDDEDALTPKNAAQLKASSTLVCAIRVIGGMSVGTLATNEERKEREIALTQLVCMALLDLKSGCAALGVKEAAFLYKQGVAALLPENLIVKKNSLLVRTLEEVLGAKKAELESMVNPTTELLSLVAQFPPVPDAVLLQIAAPFYFLFTKEGTNKARTCFETTVAAITAGVTAKGLGGSLALNSSVNVDQIVDRWVQYVMFERTLTKDLVRSQELVRRAIKALGTSAQQFQIRLTDLGNVKK